MTKKEIKFYLKFQKSFLVKKLNHCFVQVSDGGVIWNSDLKL